MALWTPKNIATALWLDAADSSTITESSGAVSQWNDKSGNGRNATQSNSSFRPLYSASRINGKPAIFSDGIDDIMVFSSAVCPNNFSIFAVGQTNSTDNQKPFVFNQFTQAGAGRMQTWFPRDGNTAGIQIGQFVAVTSTFTLNANVICEWSRVSGTGTVTVNATDTNTGAITDTIESGNSSIFGRTLSSVYSQVTIGELVLVANGASTATRQLIEGYLAHKWGLQSNLPSNHPYKWFAPGSRTTSSFSARYAFNPPPATDYRTVRIKQTDHASLREGLVGAWCPSIAGSGFTLPDLSGRGNHGTLTNMAASDWVSGQYGRALDFDYIAGASRQAVELSSRVSLRGLAIASFSLWCNLQAAPAINGALYYESTGSAGFTKFGIFQTPANALLFVCRDTSAGSSFTVTHTPTAGQWIYVAGSYNANSDLMELFVNGISVGTNTTAKGNLVDEVPASSIAIGAFTQTEPSVQYSADALIDDIRIYNRVLTESEIRLLASRPGIGLTTQRRTAYYAPPSFNAGRLRRQQLIGSGVY